MDDIVAAIKDFIKDEDQNLCSFEFVESKGKDVVLSMGEGLNFTLKIDEKGITGLSDESELFNEKVTKSFVEFIKDDCDAKNCLDHLSTQFLDDAGDEEGGEMDVEDDDEMDEIECGTPMDPSLFEESDPFAVVVKKSGKKSEYEEMEELKKKFDLKGCNKAAVSRLLKDVLSLDMKVTTKLGFFAYPKGSNLFDWEVKLFNFKSDNPKAPLTKDLQTYKSKFGIDHVIFSMTFPPSYPFKPPFIRVIKPRMKFRTGHITIGGSICMQMLTTSGWMPANSIEAIFVNIRLALISGGCKIDFGNTSEYTLREAKEAFFRVSRRYGWEK